MCTVTFIPNGSNPFLTSNRDEQSLRQAAALPEIVKRSSGRILYPADGKAGGTWIACHENGNVMVLLNGAFQKHIPEATYRKSRGLIFLDIFDHASPSENFSLVPLKDIEPFTLVIYDHAGLTEARWDGDRKFTRPLDATQPYIWSSVTLYDETVRKKREEWFALWRLKVPEPSVHDVLRFHQFAGQGDATNDLVINRNGLLQTISITAITLSAHMNTMYYRDLAAGLTSVHEWPKSSMLL
jgi:hypothetical protein